MLLSAFSLSAASRCRNTEGHDGVVLQETAGGKGKRAALLVFEPSYVMHLDTLSFIALGTCIRPV